MSSRNPLNYFKNNTKIYKFIPWFAAYVVLTIIFGTIYTSVQQSLRLSANDPQIQIAEDAATEIKNGVVPDKVASGKVDISTSLAPFIIIYDKNGNPIAGSGYLEGYLPHISAGVPQHASSGHDNMVTWQPQAKVRIASVTVKAGDVYVLSGRNLREVEKRENTVMQLSGVGWFLSLGVLVFLYMYKPKAVTKK